MVGMLPSLNLSLKLPSMAEAIVLVVGTTAGLVAPTDAIADPLSFFAKLPKAWSYTHEGAMNLLFSMIKGGA